ncbi:MAG: hypothetical protein J5661_03820 [Bacteroidaceae bacterium]|nr:hypothetical protein [Bacteroidaceae bacterium]
MKKIYIVPKAKEIFCKPSILMKVSELKGSVYDKNNKDVGFIDYGYDSDGADVPD